MKKNNKILAFDIGGTKIASGIVKFDKNSYQISDYQKTKTPKNKDGVIRELIKVINYYQENNKFNKIGISFAGQVDHENGIVVFAPCIKGWNNNNLKKIIKEKTGISAEIDNDVKCFALGENKFGQAKKYKNAVYLAIGTSIGGAIEIDGKLYRGANNIAGEFGHMTIIGDGEKCGCGNMGCWQYYISGEAIEKLYFDLYNKKKRAKDIAMDSVRGIGRDKKVIKKAASYLAMGLVNIINTINPEIIVIGGSVVKQKEILDLAKKDALKKVLIPGRKTKIVKSDLGDEAMLVGAGLL